MSATNCPRPRMKRSSSFRGSRAPTPCSAPAPPAEGKSRSLRTVPCSSIRLTPSSLRRNCLRQDWRYCVISHTCAETECGLQQTLGDDFVLLVVTQHKSSGLLSDYRDICFPADPEGSDFIGTPDHLGRLRSHHRHNLFKRQAERQHRTHRLDQAEL